MNATLPPSVMLPPGVMTAELPHRAGDGIPFGAGRPIKPDPESRFYLAHCEIVRTRGRPTAFVNGDELMHSCLEYMQWVDQNPLFEIQKKFSPTTCKFYDAEIPKKRPYTIGALCLYLGITTTSWDDYRRDDRFKAVTQNVDEAIRNQKFEGAASGFFNAAIIARDLGLVDKQEVTGKNGGPQKMITAEMSAAEAMEQYKATREGS